MKPYAEATRALDLLGQADRLSVDDFDEFVVPMLVAHFRSVAMLPLTQRADEWASDFRQYLAGPYAYEVIRHLSNLAAAHDHAQHS